MMNKRMNLNDRRNSPTCFSAAYIVPTYNISGFSLESQSNKTENWFSRKETEKSVAKGRIVGRICAE
jgi:hypothetical protein